METTDFWADWTTRVLWVRDFEPVLYPVIRALKPKHREQSAPAKWVLRLGYDSAKEEELQREREAKKKTALAKQDDEKKPRVRSPHSTCALSSLTPDACPSGARCVRQGRNGLGKERVEGLGQEKGPGGRAPF